MEPLDAASLVAEVGRHGLGPHDVHVWFALVSADERELRDAWEVLDTSERARAERFRRSMDRTRYVSTRAHVRHLLAAYSRLRPDELTLTTTDDGKPMVAGGNAARSLRFNVSHSGAMSAIAVSHRDVGVDIEEIQSAFPWRPIADEFFSPSEVSALDHVASAERARAFFDCWVRKEAYLKALGIGLRRTTNSFTVPVLQAVGAVADLDRPSPRLGGSVVAWSVRGLHVARDYAAAVCTVCDAYVTTRWIRRT